MIPQLVELAGAPFAVLPPGIHWATMDEIRTRFGQASRRAWLFDGISAVAEALQRAKCARMYIDGSFVTQKPEPNDFDGCWDATNVVAALLDPVLLDFSNGRAKQKLKYRGEMFIAGMSNGGSQPFLDFFQRDKFTGEAKGIIGIELGSTYGALR
ncbi:DUF6932 family protein [Bradyrhizobium sp. HKCCYLRH2060]|uniref:DUF6932 family protein n=1 Tax=Bradyrhizobium sp. HKCCYLRH2060 TaxID=3420743 RepID=UPI003EB967F6